MFNNKNNDNSSQKQEKKPNFLFMGLAAAYLVYLSCSLLKDNLFAGKSEDASPIFVVFAFIFLAVAILIALNMYRLAKLQKAKDEESYNQLLQEEEDEYMRSHSADSIEGTVASIDTDEADDFEENKQDTEYDESDAENNEENEK